MRIPALLAFSATTALAQLSPAQNRPPSDSQRMGGSLRMLELIQGFQMASSPELANAINALLSDDAAHMRMAPPVR